jgi:anti-sigma regulatory factor (Ser/Thr protein kinase)
MEIAELIEIALANCAEGRVEVAALERCEVSIEAVGGLTQLVAELVDNAVAFSDPGDEVRVTGLFQDGDYLISISDRGIGIPEHLLSGLNAALSDPDHSAGLEPSLGIALVARLAARHGIGVRLVPGVPGTTARVTVPSRYVQRSEEPAAASPAEGSAQHRLRDLEVALKSSEPAEPPEPPVGEPTVDLTRLERSIRSHHGVVAGSDESRREAESFLEKVFGPLKRSPGMTERSPSRPSNGSAGEPATSDRPADRPSGVGTVTKLRVRVPGENFSLDEDDPSTVAAERAIDIRSALSRYAQGRRSAEEASRNQHPEREG